MKSLFERQITINTIRVKKKEGAVLFRQIFGTHLPICCCLFLFFFFRLVDFVDNFEKFQWFFVLSNMVFFCYYYYYYYY
jgi:hypothetical protein